MTGLLMLQHGSGKYLNLPLGPMNKASPLTPGGAAGLIELVCGALVLIGFFTRLGGLHPVGHNGGGLFLCACAARLLSDPQSGRVGGPLLLRLSGTSV